MAGMDRNTGRWIAGWPHTSQSLVDVITTPLETRVLRRIYGADDDTLQDKPQNKAIITKAVMAVAVPVARWEPRVELSHVSIAAASVTGLLGLAMRATWLPRALFGDRTPAGQPQVARIA
jgi:uncharacterized protein